jgi:hypothetical protein
MLPQSEYVYSISVAAAVRRNRDWVAFMPQAGGMTTKAKTKRRRDAALQKKQKQIPPRGGSSE